MNEQHGHIHCGQVYRALDLRFARRVKRKAQQHQSNDARHGFDRLGLGSHSTAEGLAAREQRRIRPQRPCAGSGCARGDVGDRGGIDVAPAGLHVRKLEAKGRDLALDESIGYRLHERVGHAGARAVGQDKGGLGDAGPRGERADGPVAGNADGQGSRGALHGVDFCALTPGMRGRPAKPSRLVRQPDW